MPFTIDSELIENDDVRITTDASNNFVLENKRTGDTIQLNDGEELAVDSVNANSVSTERALINILGADDIDDVLKMQPSTTKAPLAFYWQAQNINGADDPVFGWGYNTETGETQIDASTHAWSRSVEGHYVDPDGDGTRRRSFFFGWNKTTDKINWQYAINGGGAFAWFQGGDVTNTKIAEVTANGVYANDDKRMGVGNNEDYWFSYDTNVTPSRFTLKSNQTLVDNALYAFDDEDALYFNTLTKHKGNVTKDSGGTEYNQRGKPTTSEIDNGDAMTYCSDGTDGGSAGDLMYAVNDGGTIKTSVIAQRSNAT
jgi:hypothetical protein